MPRDPNLAYRHLGTQADETAIHCNIAHHQGRGKAHSRESLPGI